MASPTLLLTKLDAVNMMLASIGQAPVNSLNIAGIRDVSVAALSLDNTTREVLGRGLTFNTDTDYELAPNGANNILIPNGALFVDPSDRSIDYVMRYHDGVAKLYDKQNHTFTIRENVKVDIVWGFEFEQTPQYVRHYIAVRAARIFQSQVLGSEVLFQFTASHEEEALASLTRMEARQKDRNFFAAPTDVNLITHRTRNPRRFA